MKNSGLNWILLLACFLWPIVLPAQTGDTNQVDAQGRKQGYWRKVVNDTLKYEGQFEDDNPIGEFKYYYPDKTLKSKVEYSESGLLAKTINFYPGGKVHTQGDYWDKKQHGPWKYYDEAGTLIKEEDYHNGIPEGKWSVYFYTGTPLEIRNYTNGRLNGEMLRYFPDSLLSYKATYVNDKLNGVATYYYLNGKVMLTGTYKDDNKDAFWMFFNELGIPETRTTYINGNLTREEINVRGPDHKVSFIDMDLISYVFSYQGQVIIRMKEGEDLISERSIDDFMKILNEYKFYRVNANYIISLYSFVNRTTYSGQLRVLELKPAAPATVYLSDTYAEGFTHWAGLIKGEVDPKNPPQNY